MVSVLVKHFVKDYENTANSDVRTSYGVLASVIGIVCNVFLFAVKFIVGMILNSISVMADAFNNLSDAASSVISFVGVKIANRPADKEHPFGHGRVEYVAAFIVAFLVMEVGFSFFQDAIGKIKKPDNLSFSMISLIILCLSIIVKLWLAYLNRTLGAKIHSKVMSATAADAIGDAITTSATVISILVFRFAGINIDGIVGVLVSLIVMYAGINIARDTIAPLIGEAPDKELYEKISEKVESYEGISGTHDLIIHNYGPSKCLASIHAEVPANVSIEVSHEIIDRAEKEVKEQLGVFLVIHMDPVETDNEMINQTKKKMEDIIAEIDAAITIHDFRLVTGKENINLIFDMVLPYEYSGEKEEVLQETVKQRARALDARFNCVISIDRQFV